MYCLSRLLCLTIKVSGVSGLHAQQFVEEVLRQGLEHAHLISQRTKTLSPMHGHAILKIVSLSRNMNFFHQCLGCIDYRQNVHCESDVIYESTNELKTTSVMPTLQAEQGYGRCASLCLGIPGSVSFNWKVQGSVGHCQCKRMVLIHDVLS